MTGSITLAWSVVLRMQETPLLELRSPDPFHVRFHAVAMANAGLCREGTGRRVDDDALLCLLILVPIKQCRDFLDSRFFFVATQLSIVSPGVKHNSLFCDTFP